jgi:glyoxylase-like metal-dependent hydrolase (beta-lactamase superfamily II)
MTHVPEPVDDGIWRWTARHAEWHPGEFGAEVACFALDTGAETLLVDPLLPGGAADADTIAALDDIVRDPVAVLVSIPYHTRSAEPLADRYGATIHGHPAVRKRLSSSERFTPVAPDADGLPGGARFFPVGKPRRFEMPIWLPSHAALVFGDAVVEHGGELRVWAQSKVDDKQRRFIFERFNPTLAPLVELEPARVLVTHGRPVLSAGARELARALEREPFWHHG